MIEHGGLTDTRDCAQRRPDHKLRRHTTWRGGSCSRRRTLNEGRSISSGDTCIPACWRAELYPLNEGRSISSGDTIRTIRGGVVVRPALNEGRSISSGDTCRVVTAGESLG